MFQKVKNLFFSKLFLKNLGLVILVHLLVVYLVLLYLEISTKHGEQIEVPLLVGLTVDQAREKLQDSNLGFEILDSIYCPCLPEGTVVEQLIDPTKDTIWSICDCSKKVSGKSLPKKIPPSNVYVKSGRTIPLRLSKKREFVEVPDLVHKQIEFAEDILNRRGIKTKIRYRESNELNGAVIEQFYNNEKVTAGLKIPIGKEVTLIVGQNLLGSPIPMPNLVGMYRNDAFAVLRSLDITNYFINCLGCQSQLDSISSPITKQVPEFYEGATVFKGTQFTLTIEPVIANEDEN